MHKCKCKCTTVTYMHYDLKRQKTIDDRTSLLPVSYSHKNVFESRSIKDRERQREKLSVLQRGVVRVYLKGILQGCGIQYQCKRASVKSPWELTLLTGVCQDTSSENLSIRLRKKHWVRERGWDKLKRLSRTLETKVLTIVFIQLIYLSDEKWL